MAEYLVEAGVCELAVEEMRQMWSRKAGAAWTIGALWYEQVSTVQ
jgi:hypothetical protein